MTIGRKHRIKDLLDLRISNDESDPSIERQPVHAKGWQFQRFPHETIRVGKQFKREVQALGDLRLILGFLSRKTKDSLCPRILNLDEVIPKAAGFGCATARTGNVIPARRKVFARPPGQGVNVNDRPALTESPQGNRQTSGAHELDVGEVHAEKMIGRPIVFGNRQV